MNSLSHILPGTVNMAGDPGSLDVRRTGHPVWARDYSNPRFTTYKIRNLANADSVATGPINVNGQAVLPITGSG